MALAQPSPSLGADRPSAPKKGLWDFVLWSMPGKEGSAREGWDPAATRGPAAAAGLGTADTG